MIRLFDSISKIDAVRINILCNSDDSSFKLLPGLKKSDNVNINVAESMIRLNKPVKGSIVIEL